MTWVFVSEGIKIKFRPMENHGERNFDGSEEDSTVAVQKVNAWVVDDSFMITIPVLAQKGIL